MTLTSILEYAMIGCEQKIELYDKLMENADTLESETMSRYYESMKERYKKDLDELVKLGVDNIVKRRSSCYKTEKEFTI